MPGRKRKGSIKTELPVSKKTAENWRKLDNKVKKKVTDSVIKKIKRFKLTEEMLETLEAMESARRELEKHKPGSKVRAKFAKISKARASARKRAYLEEAKRLRGKVKAGVVAVQKTLRIAQKISRREVQHIKIDKLGTALSELGKQKPFQGKEIARVFQKGTMKDRFGEGPAGRTMSFFYWDANQITERKGSGEYTSITYFEKDAFKKGESRRSDLGKVEAKKSDLIALQVMHWNPKKLLEATKAMLKRRKRNPIPIYDLYGNRFFP